MLKKKAVLCISPFISEMTPGWDPSYHPRWNPSDRSDWQIHFARWNRHQRPPADPDKNRHKSGGNCHHRQFLSGSLPKIMFVSFERLCTSHVLLQLTLISLIRTQHQIHYHSFPYA